MTLLIGPWVLRRMMRSTARQRWGVAGLVLLGTVAADVDIGIGFAAGLNGFAVHGGYSHSILAAVAFGLVAAALAWGLGWLSPGVGFVAGGAAYGSHLLLDAVNYGRGIALLWPVSSERYSAPVRLFYGVRHSVDADWRQHLITLGTELIFVAVVAAAAWLMYGRSERRGLAR